MAIEMRLEGVAELKRRLDELATKDSARMMKNALQAGAEVFQEEEAANAPERPNLPSGNALPVGALKRDVQIKKIPGKMIFVIGPGKFTQQAAHLVEMGHRLVRGGKNRIRKFGKYEIQVGAGEVVGFVPAHPYIRPAYEAKQQAALDAIAESLEADLAKLSYKNQRKGGR